MFTPPAKPAPGLRLGWLVVPARLVDEVTAAKALTDRHSSSFDQLTLAEFIRRGLRSQVRRRGWPTGGAGPSRRAWRHVPRA
jgi:DNA-binding transcriptional MocR family regulator